MSDSYYFFSAQNEQFILATIHQHPIYINREIIYQIVIFKFLMPYSPVGSIIIAEGPLDFQAIVTMSIFCAPVPPG